jgi:hypothetical protein
MSITLLASSSAVQVTLQANAGLPANFSVFNEDAGIGQVTVPAFVPGQASIVITIARLAPFGGTCKLHAQGTGYPSAQLNVVIEAVPNAFTWLENTATQVP